MKTILVTGGAGFIGSNFIDYIFEKHPEYKIVNLDLLTYAGNLENLKHISDNSNYSFIKGDIRDRKLIEKIFNEEDIDYVVNFAAESHVDRSIEDPDVFLTTNILGTQVLLDVAKNNWNLDQTNRYNRDYRDSVKFVQVSTDEVYGSLGETGAFTEEHHLLPNSPYSASKASADLIVRAYAETYGLPVNITRCSNNYGPYQFPEKLIPLMIHNSLNNKPLPIYGDGKQVRDWLYVKDHCSAIDKIMHEGELGEVYNIGGNNEKENIEIVKIILEETDKGEELITYVQDRLGHDRRYAIDHTKLNKLGWSPEYDFNTGMRLTIDWYLENLNWMENITSGEYMNYYEDMYGDRL